MNRSNRFFGFFLTTMISASFSLQGLARAEGEKAGTPPPAPTSTSTAPVGVAPAEQRTKMGFDFSKLAHIPVQSGGRIKPFDTYAREQMLFETGSRFFESWDPSDLMLSFMIFPDAWESRPFIQVNRPDVRRQVGLDEMRTRFAPKELVSESYLAQYFNEMNRAQPTTVGIVGQKEKSEPREDELKRVVERIALYRRMVAGQSWPLIPSPGNDPWLVLSGKEEAGLAFRGAFARMAIAYRDGNKEGFQSAAEQLDLESKRLYSGDYEVLQKEMSVETLYNRTHPFIFSWVIYLAAGLLWAAALILGNEDRKGHPKLRPWAMALTFLGLGFHIFGFGLRCYIAGRPPVSNMYESVIWVTFGAMAFSLIIFAFQRQVVLLATSCFLASFGMIIADFAPAIMDPGIHPLVPVLRSNYWLTIHVLTITLGYSAFMLSMGLGNVTLWHYLRNPKNLAQKVANLNQLTYRSLQIGVVLLAAGTILGGVWADYSWGRFWGWDPKEVWALIALLNYLSVLHGRYAGWVGTFGFAMWSVAAFMGVVMAWYGVNFVLGVGLHSYGFSSGGRGTVAVFVALQLLYCFAAWAVTKGRKLRATKLSQA